MVVGECIYAQRGVKDRTITNVPIVFDLLLYCYQQTPADVQQLLQLIGTFQLGLLALGISMLVE